MQSRRSKSSSSKSTLPASILEKSRMSLITFSKESADNFTVSKYSRCSRVSSVSSVRSVIPMMPLSGVRISWLMFARNSPFARLPASAASFAFPSSTLAYVSILISSACLRSVMLWETPIVPIIWPCRFRSGTFAVMTQDS